MTHYYYPATEKRALDRLEQVERDGYVECPHCAGWFQGGGHRCRATSRWVPFAELLQQQPHPDLAPKRSDWEQGYVDGEAGWPGQEPGSNIAYWDGYAAAIAEKMTRSAEREQ